MSADEVPAAGARRRGGNTVSTCISRAGEFGTHETQPGNYICDLCGVLDEDGIFTEIAALRAKVSRVEALATLWLDGHGPGSRIENVMGQQSVTISTAVREMRAALAGGTS